MFLVIDHFSNWKIAKKYYKITSRKAFRSASTYVLAFEFSLGYDCVGIMVKRKFVVEK